MRKTEKSVLKALQGDFTGHRPIWLMRQAGRYLPEYMELRKQSESFIHFCLSPKLAAEATLQPIRRFGMDAAILFADILLVPHAFHQKISFEEKKGPILEPLEDVRKLNWDCERLEPVFETIERVKDELSEDTSFIGFSGGLWTIACYMVEGRGQTGFIKALDKLRNDEKFVIELMDLLHDATFEYLARQIEAGVDLIQIFDSHAGLLSGASFDKYVIKPTQKLVQAIKAEYPDFPVIGFPRGARPQDYLAYAQTSGVDCVSLDQLVTLPFAKDVLQPVTALQGNMDPSLLLRGGKEMRDAAQTILETLGPRHIFNLGHGVIKETPPAHVADLVDFVRNYG